MRIIDVKVITKAGRNEVVKISDRYYKVKVSSVAERGEANAQVIALLAKHFDVPKSRIVIIQGARSKLKRISL